MCRALDCQGLWFPGVIDAFSMASGIWAALIRGIEESEWIEAGEKIGIVCKAYISQHSVARTGEHYHNMESMLFNFKTLLRDRTLCMDDMYELISKTNMSIC